MRFPLYPKCLFCSGRGDLCNLVFLSLSLYLHMAVFIWPIFGTLGQNSKGCKFHVGMWLPNNIRSDFKHLWHMVFADWSSMVCRQVSLWRVMSWVKEITPDAADYLLEILTVEPDEDRLLKHRSTSSRSYCLTLGAWHSLPLESEYLITVDLKSEKFDTCRFLDPSFLLGAEPAGEYLPSSLAKSRSHQGLVGNVWVVLDEKRNPEIDQ